MTYKYIPVVCTSAGNGFDYMGIYPAFGTNRKGNMEVVRYDHDNRFFQSFEDCFNGDTLGDASAGLPEFHLLSEKELREHDEFMRRMELDSKFWDFIQNPEGSKWYIPFISVVSATATILTILILSRLGWL